MKHITVLYDNEGVALAAHSDPDAVWQYRAQLIKEDPTGEYKIEEHSYKKLMRAVGECLDDLYLVPVGDNWIPSSHVDARNEIIGDLKYDYQSAIKALYRFAEMSDRKLNEKDIKALTKVICMLNDEIDYIENEPISRATLEEVSQSLKDLNWRLGKD